MTISRRSLVLALGMLAVAACTPATASPRIDNQASDNEYANPQLLLSTDALAQLVGKPEVRIVDMRTKEKYQLGHVPGAVNFDTSLLKDPDDKLYVPRPEIFSKLMEGLGIGSDSRVVAYDDGGGLGSARLWWVLDYYGNAKVQIVNGGWSKWSKESRPSDSAAPSSVAAKFTPKIKPDVICALDVVQNAVETKNYIIVDARTAAEYNGTDVRAQRGGHIPGAINIDWQRNVTNDDLKVWKPAAELRKMYEDAGVTKDKKIITYCQTAVRAAHTLFTLKLLGYGEVRNYDGSWAEWGNDSKTPIQR